MNNSEQKKQDLIADSEWLNDDINAEYLELYKRIKKVLSKGELFSDEDVNKLDIKINIDDPYYEKKTSKQKVGMSIKVNDCVILYTPYGYSFDKDTREDRGITESDILNKKNAKHDWLKIMPVTFKLESKKSLKRSIKALKSLDLIIDDILENRNYYTTTIFNCENFQALIIENTDKVREIDRLEKLKDYELEIALIRKKVFNYTNKESEEMYDKFIEGISKKEVYLNSTGKTLSQVKIESDGSLYFERYHIKMHRDREGEIHHSIRKGYNGKFKKVKKETMVKFISECNYYSDDFATLAKKYGKQKKREDRKIHIYDLIEKMNERQENKSKYKNKETIIKKIANKFK